MADRDQPAGLPADLEPQAAEAFEQGRSAWPGVALDRAAFDATLAEKIDAAPEPDPARALGSLHSRDLYLATACALGISGAAEALEQTYFSDLDAVIRYVGGTPSTAAEVKQHMRATLLVAGAGDRPRIAGYGGRGTLRSWLRSVAVRTAMKQLRAAGKQPSSDDDALDALVDEDDDPEVAHLKQTYAAELRQAFAEALAALTPRQRNLLRQHYIDGLSIDRIAPLYQVHRATVARWLAAARQALHDDTRARLTAQVGLPESQFASVARMVQSQLDLSIARFLDE